MGPAHPFSRIGKYRPTVFNMAAPPRHIPAKWAQGYRAAATTDSIVIFVYSNRVLARAARAAAWWERLMGSSSSPTETVLPSTRSMAAARTRYRW